MSANDLWDIQPAVKAAVDAALVAAGLPAYPVFAFPPDDPPAEFVRIDGFTLHGMDMKNGPRGRHSFMVHFFQSGTNSERRAKEVIAAICQHFRSTKILGASVTLEFAEASHEGANVAHAFARFSAIL